MHNENEEYKWIAVSTTTKPDKSIYHHLLSVSDVLCQEELTENSHIQKEHSISLIVHFFEDRKIFIDSKSVALLARPCCINIEQIVLVNCVTFLVKGI